MCCARFPSPTASSPYAQGQRFLADHTATRLKQTSQVRGEAFGHRGDGHALEQQASERVESEVAAAGSATRHGAGTGAWPVSYFSGIRREFLLHFVAEMAK
jgi:hypothetical protein